MGTDFWSCVIRADPRNQWYPWSKNVSQDLTHNASSRVQCPGRLGAAGALRLRGDLRRRLFFGIVRRLHLAQPAFLAKEHELPHCNRRH